MVKEEGKTAAFSYARECARLGGNWIRWESMWERWEFLVLLFTLTDLFKRAWTLREKRVSSSAPSSAQALTRGPLHPERAALTDDPPFAPRVALTAVPAQDDQRLGQALENGSSNKDNIKNEKSNHKTESRGGGRGLGDNSTSSCL